MKLLIGWMIGTTALFASVARAELTDEQKQVEMEMQEIEAAVVYAKENGNRASGSFQRSYEDCLAVIARGEKLGIPPNEVMLGQEKYLWKRVKQKCEDYKTWSLLVKAAEVVGEVAGTYQAASSIEVGKLAPEAARGYGAMGTTCLGKLDKLIAAGAPADVAVPVDTVPMTLAEARKVCETMASWGGKYAAETEKVRAAEAAAIRAKYTSAGIGGDRLRIILANGEGAPLEVKGCGGGVTDPKALKKAPLLISRFNTQSGYAVRKYRFSGDKLVKEEFREFSRIELSYAWCK